MSVYRVSSNKSSVNNFPTVRPTLDLDFANSKTLDPRITFTRSSGGSYVGADGLIKLAGVNEARFDHDPYTGESLGLLIEESRTNLLLRSEEFVSSWLAVRATITANATIAPNGTNTASKLVENTATDNHFTRQAASTTLLDNTIHTFSVYAKAAERTTLCLVFRTKSNGFPTSYFNLIDGTVSGISGGMTATMQNVGNGWYRCSVSQNIQSGVTNPEFYILTSTGTFIQVYPGDGTSGIFIWGAQLEQGSFPTSYIPTEGSTRTRAADNASITGKNFSDFYRQDEGTVLVNFNNKIHSSSILDMYLVTIFVSSNFGRRMSSRIAGQESVALISTMRTFAFLTDFTYALEGNTYISGNGKSIFNYEDKNYFSQCLNGGNISLDTTGNISESGFNSLVVGRESGLTRYLNGTISRLTYYPKRLPDAQLQALTK